MAKDKPVRKITMKEVIAESAERNPVANSSAPSQNESDPSLDSPLFSEEQNEKLKRYNENIMNFDPKYTELIPRFNVLVRVFVTPMEIGESGVIKPNTVPVQAPTQSGVSTLGYMNNPFPFSTKAVIVSVPEEIKDLNTGDIVALSKKQVIGQPIGRGDNARIVIPNVFLHPDEASKYSADETMPHDPEDPNYGYMEIKPYDIPFIIKKAN